jgi:hypothetical protein
MAEEAKKDAREEQQALACAVSTRQYAIVRQCYRQDEDHVMGSHDETQITEI